MIVVILIDLSFWFQAGIEAIFILVLFIARRICFLSFYCDYYIAVRGCALSRGILLRLKFTLLDPAHCVEMFCCALSFVPSGLGVMMVIGAWNSHRFLFCICRSFLILFQIPLSVISLLDLCHSWSLVFEQDHMTFETMANACNVRLDESDFISTTSLWPDSSRLSSVVHAV